MTYAPLESLLAETFGKPLLAYLCAADEQLIEQRLTGSTRLSAAAEQVLLGPLSALAQQIAPELAKHQGLGPGFFLDLLASRDAAADMSFGNALRQAAGGEVAETTASDGSDLLLESLLAMAVDAYPVFLAPAAPFRAPHLSFFRHPLRTRVDAALVDPDEPLSRLFPSEDPGLGRRGFIVTSLGRGSSVQSVMFAEMVLGSAWASAVMSSASPSVDELLTRLRENLAVLRRAALGESSEVRARVAFTGFRTAAAMQIATPWGSLRPLTDAERSAAPPSLEGAVGTTLEDGRQVQVSYVGELVLDTVVPYRISVQNPPDYGAGPPTWPTVEGRNTLPTKIELLQLTALLGVDRPPASRVIAKPTWNWTADPLGYGTGMSWWDPKSAPGFVPYELSDDEVQAFERWATLIAAAARPSVRVAIRRCLSAAHERANPADRLVDAVIVWENLFGSSEGEPRLRISAAMAWLLGTDGGDRRRLQLALKRIYDSRSKVVHGGDVTPEELVNIALDALGFSVEILKVLFQERHDILSLPDGAARSLAVLLDDPRAAG